MYLDVSQIRFICNKDFEPVRYERLNKMIDTLGLNRDIIRFHSPTYKHTITNEQFNTHVRSSLQEKLHWVGRKYQRRSDLSLVLNYLYNLEEIEKEFEDGIFIIFESDVDVKDNFKELPKLIEVLKQNTGKWDLVHFGQNGHNGEEDKKYMWQSGFIEDLTKPGDQVRLERKLDTTRCTDSHIISMSGIKKLLHYYRTQTDYYIPIDYYFIELMKSNYDFKYYWSDPTYCFQRSNLKLEESAIQNDRD
jgi:hypothetical protein